MSKDNLLPYYAAGKIVKGFGRGSKALGIPTANFPEEVVAQLPEGFNTGIYYGWAALEGKIYKMVMSIGWNPFYQNEKKSMEVHILHKFSNDLHGKELKVVITGFVRPEANFDSVDALIAAINNDIKIADERLDDPKMLEFKSSEFLTNS
ncbi:riboflavin kinase [Microplitis demolitor]|uniref:riboflavin kinase n=1 Tax=Microplitis demolitor TaxID=69319 RepID=UPI0004CD1DED|nr:riboflavin kinase [Microplitis demolitor]XP_008555937.1 riboflavin kinase [Microplitis demolitor]XP_008555938.1 riboflavin kinase [Microplitis demolitor]XP_008555939.1 riboflavin kinase [Microplitis demolitor]XP_008555940.1 riboflavin kinase [Microplitis demolitor]XP_008555942.1 riboflavin kinase [Microplitis demolitor]XP_008555943.1 riboflavin kinase [Microplitis demolitor]XP_014297135.1 riboflavin kinase [Microplitis demolitor]XP_014297136.1 riboflavin kinase [Microplitis demolitor]